MQELNTNGVDNRIRCPSPEHPGDGDGDNCSIQKMPDGRWRAHCWSHGCHPSGILRALGISQPDGWQDNEEYVIAAYEHPDGELRPVYRKDYPRDFPPLTRCSWPGCSQNVAHKHVWGKKGLATTGCYLKLWGKDYSDNKLLVVEGEKAADHLLSIGINEEGFTPVTWRGGSKTPKQSNWKAVSGRDVVFWPDNDTEGAKAMNKATFEAQEAGASGLYEVHPVSDPDVKMPDKGDAADLDEDDIWRVLDTMTPKLIVRSVNDVPVSDKSLKKADRIITPDASGMKSLLEYLNLEIRNNIRCSRIEIRRSDWPGKHAQEWSYHWDVSPGYNGWLEMTDDILEYISNKSVEEFEFSPESRAGRVRSANWSSKDRNMALLAMCERKYVDPFIEWLEDLPEWDGKERIDRLWIDTIMAPDTELSREAGRRFMIGAVRRAYEPGCVHDWMPVLVGPQGLGKSSMLRELMSDSPEWFSDGTQIDGDARQKLETTGPAVINEFQEMGGYDKPTASYFKGWIVARSDRSRAAYARYARRIDRRWVGVGTANDDPEGVLPYDKTGSRRYVVLKSTFSGSYEETFEQAARARAWVRKRMKQLWAEALEAYNEDDDDGINLIPGNLRDAQEEISNDFVIHQESITNIAYNEDIINKARETEIGLPLQEIIAIAKLPVGRSTERDLAGELFRAGWRKYRKVWRGVGGLNATWRWFPPVE